jgi:hypothetical protein
MHAYFIFMRTYYVYDEWTQLMTHTTASFSDLLCAQGIK